MRAAVATDPEVRALVLELGEGERYATWLDEHVRHPAAFARLVAKGPAAVPALLRHASSSPDRWTRVLLIDVLGRIGDPRALPFVTARLTDEDADVRSVADAAVLRLLPDAGLQALQKGPRRLEVLAERVRRGELDAIDELLRIADPDAPTFYDIERALLLHRPLRLALGFDEHGETMVLDGAGFLRAAREWHLETVGGRRSPWKCQPREVLATLPAPASLQAFSFLRQRIHEQRHFGAVRVLPRPVRAAPPRPMQVLFAYGHSDSLVVDTIRPHRGGWLLERLRHGAAAAANSTFDGDRSTCRHYRAELTDAAYRHLRLGLETMLAAEMLPWWNGPDGDMGMSSGDFAFAIRGVRGAQHWNGYPSSDGRATWIRIEAVRDFYFDHLPELAECRLTRAEIADQVLLDAWQHHRDLILGPTANYYVRARMLGIAAALGTPAMAAELRPWFFDADRSGRASEALCTAMAACSGVDLRFHEDGRARTPAEAFAAYRNHLR